MLDQIDYYITHMDEFYRDMNLNKAYLLTIDFFENIVSEIYLSSIRKRIIAFPNADINLEHFYVLRKLLSLISVITPLFPFTAYHISNTHLMKWPEI